MIVYKYTNKNNGKVYIGITTKSIKERHRQHLNSLNDGTYFHNAIKKHGIKAFDLEVIDETEFKEDLGYLEKYYIEHYNSFAYKDGNNGYNCTLGGEGLTGQYGELNSQYGISPQERMDEETYKNWLKNIRKASKRNSGENHYCYGKHPKEIFGEEAWNKNVELARERFQGENNPNRLNPKFGKDNPNFGKKYSDKIKKKMRDARSDQFVLDEEKVKSILKLYFEEGLTQKEIAKKYKIARQTVSDIATRRIYNHIEYKYDYETALQEKEKARVRKVSKPIAMIDNQGQIIKKAKSIKEMTEIAKWSQAGILKHLKNRVKKPIFIYLWKEFVWIKTIDQILKKEK